VVDFSQGLPSQRLPFPGDVTFLALAAAFRALFFAPELAEFCLVLDTSFLDSATVSASLALTRLVISRLSPVSGMLSPSGNSAGQPVTK
jgi:hypothetical protein